MKMDFFRSRNWSALLMLSGLFITAGSNAATVLLQEDFQGITGFGSGGDPRIFGVPTTNGLTDSNTKTIGNADNDWYAARFEAPDGGAIYQDVGAQKFGGGGNNSIVGVVEDDAGVLIRIDTTNYTNYHYRLRLANIQRG
jgi:hypothetical protein